MPIAATTPYEEVTRRWTQLPPKRKDEHAYRLLGIPLAEVEIGTPKSYRQDHYLTLVTAALDGDAIAFAWLAESHRALLVSRGRTLLQHDPDTWAEVALEALHQGLRRAADAVGPWSRRRVALHLRSRMARAVRINGRRADIELATDPHVLPSYCRDHEDPYGSVHPELTEALDTALARVEPATAEGLRAAARLEPLTPVAEAHRIDEAALRQRMARTRCQLRPQLAGFARTGT
jgi:hypothetical protein